MYYNYTHGNQELTEILHLSRMDYLGRNWIVDVCEGKNSSRKNHGNNENVPGGANTDRGELKALAQLGE